MQGNFPIRVVEGTYGFEQLAEWRKSMLEVHSIDGVVYTDIDERENKLGVGVSSESARRKVKDMMRKLPVPLEAVVIKGIPQLHYAEETLQDEVRPIPGAMQIAFGDGNPKCTLGINVYYNDTPAFLTNSHCSSSQGSVDGGSYWQPNPSESSVIGHEIADPSYSSSLSGCPSGAICRKSDAAVVEYVDGSLPDFPQIASTYKHSALGGQNPNYLTINGKNEVHRVQTSTPNLSGYQVSKNGRTTGITHGEITETCTTIGVAGENRAHLCQSIVEKVEGQPYPGPGIANAGDSGSAVMWGAYHCTGYWGPFGSCNGDFVWRRTFFGLLWGSDGNGDNPGTVFAFSPVHNIEDELSGSLQYTTN
jgi:hypothetical protein